MPARFTLRLPDSEPPPPHCFNKLCDIADFQDADFRLTAAAIFGVSSQVPEHRKLWEFTIARRALARAGAWSSDALGLSVAGGKERFLFYAANEISLMVSVDIYGSGDFAGNEASDDFLSDQLSAAPFPYREEHLKVLRMNGCRMGFEDNLFDFAVCFSSLEHFGGVSAATKAIREMGRVVRPGGCVSFTTECALNGFGSPDVFTVSQLMDLVGASGLELYQPINFYLTPQTQNFLIDMRKDDLATLPHMNLRDLSSVFTSVHLILTKKLSSESLTSAMRREKLDDFIREYRNPSVNELESGLPARSWMERRCVGLKRRIEQLWI